MDPVRRQLKLLDAQLQGRARPISYILTTAPLLLLTVSMAAGVIIQHYFNIHIALSISALGFAIFLAIIACFTTPLQRRLLLLTIAALAAFASLGAIRLKSFYTSPANEISNFVGSTRVLATLRGIVRTTPFIEDKESWAFGSFLWGNPATSFYMAVDQIDTPTGFKQASGTVRVQVADTVKDVEPGDRIELHCWLSRFNRPANPGQFDLAESLKRRKIYVGASVSNALGITVLVKHPPGSLFYTFRGKLKKLASEALLNEYEYSSQSNAMLAALILGERSNINPTTNEAFRKTGLAHFISLSGMHIGILAGTLWMLCKHVGLTKHWRAVLCMTLIGLYMLIVPARAPTVRACIIFFAFCTASILRRKTHPINSLSLAAIILLLIHPTYIFTAGFQLSFMTVLGILFLYDPIENFLLENLLERWPRIINLSASEKPFAGVGYSMLVSAVKLLSVGVSAWLGGVGVLLHHFGVITPLASLWTILVFPMVMVILIFGFAKIAFASILPTIAALCSVGASTSSNGLISIVSFISHIDKTALRLGNVSAAVIILYYCVMFFLRVAPADRTLTRRFLLVGSACVMVFYVSLVLWTSSHRRDLEMTILDVGHGQAAMLQMPGNQNILFDAGSLTAKDCGQRIVIPFLKHKGISKLDAIFISHDDIDHLNGIPEIAATVDVDNIFVNGGFIRNTSSTNSYLKMVLGQIGKTLTVFEDGFCIGDRATVRAVWPDNEICAEPSIDDNDKSQVFVIEFAGRRIMICSDIESFAQNSLLEKYPTPNIDVVIMPHHGSQINLIDGFVEKLGAETIIVSCSRTRQASAYKPKNAVNGFYTPIDGAVNITISPDGSISMSGHKSKL